MDLSKQTLEQLKGMAYEQIKLLSQTQNNIQILEKEIDKRANELETKPVIKK